jgi:hypothetical protein
MTSLDPFDHRSGRISCPWCGWIVVILFASIAVALWAPAVVQW